MKFKIRYADQIVGFFIIAALVSLIFVIIMLGSGGRMFKEDKNFRTQFPSAAGLSKNMPVTFRGFVIGNVVNFTLNGDNNVDVVFRIHEEFTDRVKRGSMVELAVSPIGLGNQFRFHAGRGTETYGEDTFIPAVGTPEANALIVQGLADDPGGDSIGLLLNRAPVLLEEITDTVAEVKNTLLILNDSLITGNDETELGRIVNGVKRSVDEVPVLLSNLDTILAEVISAAIEPVLEAVAPILEDAKSLTHLLVDPDSDTIYTILGEGDSYDALVDSLRSLWGILDSLDKTLAFLPSQIPQLANTLTAAEEVLVALTNNPLLRGGVPERANVQSSGTSPRNIRF